MRQNNNIEDITGNNWQENVEVVRNTPWYGNPWITSAACFVVLLGSTIGIMTLFNGKVREPEIPDNPPITAVETTTEAVTAETTTDGIDVTNADIQTTTVVETVTEAITEEITEIPTEAQTEAPTELTTWEEIVPNAEGLTVDDAEKLINAVNFAEQLRANAPGVAYDMEDSFTDDNGQLYVRITEEGFNTIDDVRRYLETYITPDAIEKYYGNFFDGSGILVENNGLYVRYRPTSGGFQRVGEVIAKTSDDEIFSVIEFIDDFGTENSVELKVCYHEAGCRVMDIIYGR